MTVSKKIIIIALLLATLVVTAFSTLAYIKRAAFGYVYGYPLVIMELTRRSFALSAPDPAAANNFFTHHRTFPDHNFRNVVRANNDTLYSIAWLDLGAEPVVLSVPDTHGRYFVMPFMDAWTNVYARVGKLSQGSEAGEYIVTGPDWQGEVPAELSQIKAPTNMGWIIGRTQTNGRADIPKVAALQAGFFITPLSLYQQGQRRASVIVSDKEAFAAKSHDPYLEAESFSAVEYFSLLTVLMSQQPPAAADTEMLSALDSIGISAHSPRAVDDFNVVERYLLQLAVDMTNKKMKEKIAEDRPLENGWGILRDTIGDYGTNYPVRAGVARIGLGAMVPKEAIYPSSKVDAQLRPLSGEHRYRVHFAPGQTPPVDAFWSLTLYNKEGFMVESAINRYSIGDRDPLVFNSDGSLDILIQPQPPADKQSNWLPSAEGAFEITLRAYAPRESLLNGEWLIPGIERL